jgi:hypothetical protein
MKSAFLKNWQQLKRQRNSAYFMDFERSLPFRHYHEITPDLQTYVEEKYSNKF